MHVKSLAAAAICCAVAAPAALAQIIAPPAPSPGVAGAPPAAPGSAQWPLVLPGKGPAQLPAQPWSAQEMERAQARCAVVLKGLAVVAVPEAPIREGAECGTAAPMKLVSVGKNPQVALSPPPIVTCDMIAALHRWLERDIQPLARQHLGAPVIRLETMSSYSCRNAYNRAGPRGRLSEHGKANALDIGAFVTARGQTAMVVADWGPTARQIASEAASHARAARVAAPAQPVAAEPPRPLQAGGTIDIPGITVLFPTPAPDGSSAFGLASPSRLGGPKPPADAAPSLRPGAKMDFLRGAHGTACRLFYTVLGPEANNAHLNHFHLDMAERIKSTRVCE